MLSLFILASLMTTVFGRDDRFTKPDVLPPASPDLQYAFMILRHGIRTALYDPIPAKEEQDLFKTNWPESESRGILSEAGQEEMLHVGRSLRTRYKDVPDFLYERTEVTSTKIERAANSVENVALGMFFNSNTSENISMTRGVIYDKHDVFDHDHTCPAYHQLRQSVISEQTSRESSANLKYFKELNNELKEKYQFKEDYIHSLEDIDPIWDTWKMQQLNLKNMTEWQKKNLNEMDRLGLPQVRLWRNIHAKVGMVNFFSGPMLYQIVTEMETWTNNQIKFHLHGTHDTCLGPVYWTLVPNHESYLPQPGDTLIIELNTDNNVQLFLYSPLEKREQNRFRPISLKPLCLNDPCSLSDLRKSLQNNQCLFDEQEWKKKCTEIQDTQYRVEPSH